MFANIAINPATERRLSARISGIHRVRNIQEEYLERYQCSAMSLPVKFKVFANIEDDVFASIPPDVDVF